MFVAFFYLLRQRGLDVSLNEWMALLEGMEKGLHDSSLTGFYHLCRSIIVKSETEFDRFDQVFLEFFKDIPFKGELPEELLDWLRAMVAGGVDPRKIEKEIPFAGVLLKKDKDLRTLRNAR